MIKRNSFNRFVIGLTLLSSLLAIPRVHSQEPTPSPSPTPAVSSVDKVELQQALLDLTAPWTVMCIAAHPDDEDGTTLTVLRRKYGVHTVSLFSTYGEGGQNAVGSELYEDLGVIRADETTRAARIQGSEPYFLGLKDFGFSKSADEAFRFWGHDEALRRMVLKIRQLRPDVIITNHDTTSGHGHHQATGRLALEAFDAAADPQRFPEQLSATTVWQVKRLFVRFRRPAAETVTPEESLVVIDPNETDAVRGMSYGEQALKALQQHATQGPWPESVGTWLRMQNNQTGKLSLIRYKLTREAPGSSEASQSTTTIPFIAGLQLPDSVKGLAFPVVSPQTTTDSTDNESVLDTLLDWRKAFSRLPRSNAEQTRFALVESRLNKALAVASSLQLSVASGTSVLVPGAKDRITVVLANEGSRIFRIHSMTLNTWGRNQQLEAAEHILPGTETTVTVDVATPTTAPITVPKSQHLYDGTLNGRPLIAEANLEAEGGARFSIQTELELDVAPAVELKTITPTPYVWTPGTTNHPISFQVQVKNNLPEQFRGLLKLTSPAFRIFEFGKDITLAPLELQDVTIQANATLAQRPRRQAPVSRATTLAVELADGKMVTQRQIPVVFVDARVSPKLRVGYIPSFDRTLETALGALGVDATALSMDDIKTGELSVYHTIIIDNRGYEAHPELIANNARLLQFVSDGGTLLVFYHKDNEWNPDDRKARPQLAPYPIVLGSERVTEEDAEVRFREPRHRLLNYPNKITQYDFENWVQERGLNFPKEWDPKYAMLFSMHDTGEKPLYGGLLVAKYGKGNYIYTSMVWYRQLRAGLPGGYRMFANLISY